MLLPRLRVEQNGRGRPPLFHTRERNSRHPCANSAESRGENKEYKLRALSWPAEAGRQFGRVHSGRRNKRSRNAFCGWGRRNSRCLTGASGTVLLGRVTFGSNFGFRDPASCRCENIFRSEMNEFISTKLNHQNFEWAIGIIIYYANVVL